MKPVTKKQIAVISGIFIVIVLLLLANTTIPKKQEGTMSSEHAGNKSSLTFATIVEKAKGTLSTKNKEVLQKLEEVVKTSPDKKTAFENIINRWDSLNQPAVAAYYMEQAALASPVEKNWKQAADRYYGATRFVNDSESTAAEEKALLFSKAIECYEKTIALNPENTDAKINLAACYVEGSSNPMKGIGLLKEVEKTDSNNVNLQLNFAFFSEKSGQWNKAIERFKKVLKIQPDFIEAYLHLADAYKEMGDKKLALENLEKYKNLVDDETIKAEVQDYINQLKNT